MMINGKIDSCYELLDDNMKNEKAVPFMNNVNQLLGKHQLIDIKRITWFQKKKIAGNSNVPNFYYYEYEYKFDSLYTHFKITIKEFNGKYSINAFYGTPLNHPVSEEIKFSLKGANLFQILFFLIVIAVPVFIIITVITIIRTPMPGKKKTLWIIFSLFGYSGLKLNWATCQVMVQLIGMQLLGSGATRVGPEPWTLSFMLPLVAIMFWSKR